MSRMRGLFVILALAFIAAPFASTGYQVKIDEQVIELPVHSLAIQSAFSEIGNTTNTTYGPGAISLIAKVLQRAQQKLQVAELPGIEKHQYNDYLFRIARASMVGPVITHPWWFILAGGLFAMGFTIWLSIREFRALEGPQMRVFRSALTRGIPLTWLRLLITLSVACILLAGYFVMGTNIILPALTAGLIGLIIFINRNTPVHTDTRRSTPPIAPIALALSLVGFYIVLYWAPWYLLPLIRMLDPVSRMLNGGAASQWFLYGSLFTVFVLIFGIRMLVRHRHDRYQVFRTCSVIFFQCAFAFLIPEVLVRLNAPSYDFKNIWPLNYTFFFDWNLNQLIDSGQIGLFMLAWGLILILIAVPVFTYLYGKRWYCSWICGCGGLANTAGDTFRHLSDKRLVAWRYERWIIYPVLLFAIVMTTGVLFTFWTGSQDLWLINTNNLRAWYGFMIGSVFAGVIGTGFYPLLGTRVWCRFGCPLAAYIGLIQRFRSRFRITVNGGQCISCGNCSTYCEMGIDVRHYAQLGQDVIRASCVGCGICASVCPRGVLRLENVGSDLMHRGKEKRAVHIAEHDVRLIE